MTTYSSLPTYVNHSKLISKKVSSNFGLIPRSYDTDTDPELAEKNTTQWQRFYHHINRLNEDCRRNNPDASYRLLVLGRHGEGWHNVAEEKYGTEMWDVRLDVSTSFMFVFVRV